MAKILHHQYSGRTDAASIKERIHQVIERYEKKESLGKMPVFIGFSSDEGVRRNKGQPGAKEAPFKVREMLSSLSYTGPIYDYGTLIGEENLEESQRLLGRAVEEILISKNFPLIIGGGHETLYGHYLGVRNAFPKAKIAVINLDAHFDIRDEKPSSGTMFYQILTKDKNIDYYVFGIQESSNTRTLFETAKMLNVNYALMEEVRTTNVYEVNLEAIEDSYDIVFGTLCMDSVQESAAPGVSAPNANGFTPSEIHHMVKRLSALDNLVSFDISEVSPTLDVGDRTSRLAASIFHSFLINRESFK